MKTRTRLSRVLPPVLPVLLFGLVLSIARAAAPAPFPTSAQPDMDHTPSKAAQDDPAVVQAVLAANDRLTAAANRLDTDAFFACIVDSDATRIVQDGKLFKTRAEAMAAVRAGSQGVAKVERQYESPHVTVLAPGVALLTAEGASTATLEDGRSFGGRFAVSLVFVLRDDEWKLFHGHYSLPNPQP